MKMKNNLILLNLILFLIYLLIFILLIWNPFITNTHDVIKNILFILLYVYRQTLEVMCLENL